MKRAGLFSVLFLGCTIAFSQSLSLVYEGNSIPGNHQLIIQGPATGDEMVVGVDVTNNASVALTVLVKKVENYLITGSVNTFCWAGLCYAPNVYVSPLSTIIPAGGTTAPGEFSGHYNPNANPGQSSISYVFFDQNNVNDSVMVTILFTTVTTGLTSHISENFNLSNPYPNPANNFTSFDYQLSEPAESSLKVYSLIGSLVKEIDISSVEGTLRIETRDFEEGFYFYVLSAGNNEIKSGRFIVKH
jgi:hypothetical protein